MCIRDRDCLTNRDHLWSNHFDLHLTIVVGVYIRVYLDDFTRQYSTDLAHFEILLQEVMMTPRSRQPVLAVSGSNNINLSTKEKTEFLTHSNTEGDRSKVDERFQSCLGHSTEQLNSSTRSAESLTDTFREYLYSRSMLTASIADDSFSSRTGDFDPSTVSEEKLSDSLLYCLDGGVPSGGCSCSRDNSLGREDGESGRNCSCNQRSRVHETVL